MGSPRHVVVVGGSAAGLAAVEALRGHGFANRITVVGEESYYPYDRPPLSKQILCSLWDSGKAALRSKEGLDALNVHWKLGRRATRLDIDARYILLDDETRLHFDALLIATGAGPRRLKGGELQGVHVLRTMNDALALRAEFSRGKRMLIIGAGFLGTECAASARSAGMAVVLAYPEQVPAERPLGAAIGTLLADLHRDNGVELRPGAMAQEILGNGGRAVAVRFRDGSTCLADVILVAIGCLPATAWLEGSGLELADGVCCDEYCCAAPGIYAAGDVARWFHPGFGTHLRIEHRTNATEQSIAAARNILGARSAFSPVPYAWSDQYAERIQMYGRFPQDAEVDLVKLECKARGYIASYKRNGDLVGVLGWNATRELRALRSHLAEAARGELAGA